MMVSPKSPHWMAKLVSVRRARGHVTVVFGGQCAVGAPGFLQELHAEVVSILKVTRDDKVDNTDGWLEIFFRWKNKNASRSYPVLMCWSTQALDNDQDMSRSSGLPHSERECDTVCPAERDVSIARSAKPK